MQLRKIGPLQVLLHRVEKGVLKERNEWNVKQLFRYGKYNEKLQIKARFMDLSQSYRTAALQK